MISPINYAIFSANMLSILVCLILLYGSWYETPRKTRRSNIYSVMVITNIVALLAETISIVVDGSETLVPTIYISNILSFLLSIVLIGEFALYLTEYIQEYRASTESVVRPVFVFCGISLLVTAIACATGGLFTVEDGYFVYGELYDVYVVINIFSLLISILTVVLYRKDLGTHDCVVASVYIAIPGITALVNMFVEDWSFAYPASTLSLLVLYITIQSEQANKLEEEKEKSFYYATHDELTDLYSRRAYIDKAEELARTEALTGVIFCDVNGLKFINDTYGHKAGDDLLLRFAGLLGGLFRKEEIFRISGDEFVVLMPGVRKDTFDQRVARLEAVLDEEECPLASIGAGYGKCRDIRKLMQTAEAGMYEKKEKFHREHPDKKR